MLDARLCVLALLLALSACVAPQPVALHAVDMAAILDHAYDCRVQAEVFFNDMNTPPLTEAGLALSRDERLAWAYVYQHARTVEVIAARVAREAGLDEKHLNMRLERLAE